MTGERAKGYHKDKEPVNANIDRSGRTGLYFIYSKKEENKAAMQAKINESMKQLAESRGGLHLLTNQLPDVAFIVNLEKGACIGA